MSTTVEVKIPTIGEDPIIMFIGEGSYPFIRDHGKSRRLAGKIYIKTGFQLIINYHGEHLGYQHPITKEIRKSFQFF